MTETTINQRIKIVVESRCKSVTAYAKYADISQTTLNDCIIRDRDPRFSLIQKIVNAEPLINLEWLITGRGSMFIETAYDSDHTIGGVADIAPESIYERKTIESLEKLVASQEKVIDMLEEKVKHLEEKNDQSFGKSG